jgi:hypothetical protein
MAKRDDDHSMAEDYLAQVEWQSRRPPPYRGRELRPWWASNEPKWKYKKADGGQSPSSRVLRWIVLGVVVLIGYGIFQAFLSGADEAVYIGGAGLVAATILFFAVRDATKSKRRE